MKTTNLIYFIIMAVAAILLTVLYWFPIVDDIKRDGLSNALFIILPILAMMASLFAIKRPK